eukprot:UN00072
MQLFNEALVVQARIKKGQSILIHAITGGTGHAAVSVCKAIGLKIYGTCSNPKRDYAMKQFGLESNCIGNTRDESFYKWLLNETNGEGVDVELNSLAENKLLKSIP